MTDYAMCQRLALAMGWTNIQDHGQGLVGNWTNGGDIWLAGVPIPDPLNDAADAEKLRAWCVGQGWNVATYASTHGKHPATRELYACSGARVSSPDKPAPRMHEASRYAVGECWLRHTEEPDPRRRERIALCRAVLQALEATEER